MLILFGYKFAFIFGGVVLLFHFIIIIVIKKKLSNPWAQPDPQGLGWTS